ERLRRRRQHDLAAVARGGYPGCPVELAPRIALAGQLELAGVQADPHLDLAGRERLLACNSRLHGVARIGERIQERISLCVDRDAAMSREGCAQETAMFREGADVGGLAEVLDQSRR